MLTILHIAGLEVWQGELADVLRIDRSNLLGAAGEHGIARAVWADLNSRAILEKSMAEADADRLKGSLFMDAKNSGGDKAPSDNVADATRRGSPKMTAALERVAKAECAHALTRELCAALSERSKLIETMLRTPGYGEGSASSSTVSPNDYREPMEQARKAREEKEKAAAIPKEQDPPAKTAPENGAVDPLPASARKTPAKRST